MKTGWVIKNKDKYYIGYEQYSKKIEKAKIYTSYKHAFEDTDSTTEDKPTKVSITIKELK